MKQLIYALALLFCLFPYTQIIPLDSYTQPYALVFSVLAVGAGLPVLISNFPRRDAIALMLLAVLGTITLIITCMPSPTSQEYKYLLIYISPVIFAFAGFAAAHEQPKLADKLIVFAAAAWIGVGLVQVFLDSTFLTQLVGNFGDSADVVIDSGRGTLGLAPEPTHFGFHMVILAAALLIHGGRNGLALACLVAAILLARSSSSILALILGGIIYLAIYAQQGRWLLVAIFPAYILLGALLESGTLPESVRVVALLKDFYDDPLYLLTSDGSANARLGGIWVGAKEIIANAFIPAGMSHKAWVDVTGQILSKNSWLILLSDSGIPSGILIVIYQTGIAGLLLIGFMTYRLMSGLRSHFETLLVCSVVFVFFSQYMISTPGFGLIYGLALARRLRWSSSGSIKSQQMAAPVLNPQTAVAL